MVLYRNRNDKLLKLSIVRSVEQKPNQGLTLIKNRTGHFFCTACLIQPLISTNAFGFSFSICFNTYVKVELKQKKKSKLY
jgi:hypothetical protein